MSRALGRPSADIRRSRVLVLTGRCQAHLGTMPRRTRHRPSGQGRTPTTGVRETALACHAEPCLGADTGPIPCRADRLRLTPLARFRQRQARRGTSRSRHGSPPMSTPGAMTCQTLPPGERSRLAPKPHGSCPMTATVREAPVHTRSRTCARHPTGVIARMYVRATHAREQRSHPMAHGNMACGH